MAFTAPAAKGRISPTMNVTPLVDVVLVLLIIFMVVTPLLTKQLWLHVPKKEDRTKPEPPPADAPPPVVLAVQPNGTLRIGPEEVADTALRDKLRRIFAARSAQAPGDGSDSLLFFTADGAVPFGRAMEAMDLARGGGAATIAVLTDPL